MKCVSLSMSNRSLKTGKYAFPLVNISTILSHLFVSRSKALEKCTQFSSAQPKQNNTFRNFVPRQKKNNLKREQKIKLKKKTPTQIKNVYLYTLCFYVNVKLPNIIEINCTFNYSRFFV